jgi:hypothetical protein
MADKIFESGNLTSCPISVTAVKLEVVGYCQP